MARQRVLANRHGLDSPYGGGGHYPQALAYFTRWDGPVAEIDDPYFNASNSPPSLASRRAEAVGDGRVDIVIPIVEGAKYTVASVGFAI